MENTPRDIAEMDDVSTSINQQNNDRTSWNSHTSEDSNAQTTLYSPAHHDIVTDPKNTLQNNTLTSRKQTISPLDSNHPEEEILEELPTLSSSNASPSLPQTSPGLTTAKPNIFAKFMASLPVFAQMRKTIKAAVALLIGTIFIFDSRARAASGSSMLLVPIVVIFYFPVRTIGIQTEAVIIGTMGGLLAAAWSFLGTYLASLARDSSNPNPIQVKASAILAVFLFLGTFVLNLLRMKVHKANFGAVIACIVLSFTMTYGAAAAPFVPEITWLFLRPVALAGAISLLVNYLLWPDDSVNNFLGILRKTLGGYNMFFKEHSDAFFSLSPEHNGATLPNLNARLQNGVLLMIDCKRAVKREIIYSRISDKDCSSLSSIVKNMRTPLHGVGLSLIIKNNYLNADTKNMYFKNFKIPSILDAFASTVDSIRPICSELTDICFKATNEGSGRIGNLHYHPRTTLNSILWPFPRLWVSKTGAETQSSLDMISSSQIQKVLDRFEIIAKSDEAFFKFLELNPADIPRNGPLYLIFLYIHNLKEHATNTVKLLELIESLEKKRTHNRFWFPHQKLKKWLLSNADIGAAVGPDMEDYVNSDGNDLARVSTRQDGRSDDPDKDGDIFQVKNPDGKKSRNIMDPDVSAPVTTVQKFFNCLYIFGAWLTSTDTFFAFKTSVGVVLLAIPAWRVQDAQWYMNWRGQWTMVTLVLWMFPMTGAFLFGLIDRIAGSVVGCIAGIIIWEICQGNPYGMTAVCFVFFLPLYHIFFFVPKYRIGALMTKITALLIISYEYTYTIDGLTSYDKVWTIAGKRLVMVLIGIAASGILISIPFPPTSRVELRKNVARTIRDIGKAFGILCASAIAPLGQRAHPVVVKAFGKLALELHRQVAEERTLLLHASFEPPLRGYFPAASYAVLVEKMDNMSDLVINMGSALHQVRPEWRRHIGSILMKERKEYLSSILTILKLLSSTLSAKTSLPPYMMSPVESRQRFVNLLEKKIMIEPKDLADPSFPSYSAYLMNSLVFVDELQVLLTSIEELVGVENPEEWLMARA